MIDLINDLFELFGLGVLSDAVTFPELISYLLQVMLSIWVTCFIISGLFKVLSLGDRRLY